MPLRFTEGTHFDSAPSTSLLYSFRFCEILVCEIIILMFSGEEGCVCFNVLVDNDKLTRKLCKKHSTSTTGVRYTQHSAHAKLKILFFHVMPWQVVYKKSQCTIQYYYILSMKLLIHLQLSQFRISLIFYEFLIVVGLVVIFLNRVIVWLQSFFSVKTHA